MAIDFGTTYSGYAYALTKEPEKVHIMRKWEGMLKNKFNHIRSRKTETFFSVIWIKIFAIGLINWICGLRGRVSFDLVLVELY